MVSYQFFFSVVPLSKQRHFVHVALFDVCLIRRVAASDFSLLGTYRQARTSMKGQPRIVPSIPRYYLIHLHLLWPAISLSPNQVPLVFLLPARPEAGFLQFVFSLKSLLRHPALGFSCFPCNTGSAPTSFLYHRQEPPPFNLLRGGPSFLRNHLPPPRISAPTHFHTGLKFSRSTFYGKQDPNPYIWSNKMVETVGIY